MENMDAVQQNHRAMRPMIDPHQQQQQQQAGWYPGQAQFQYPGAQQQQWAPPPPLDHYGQVLNQHYPLPPPPPQRPMPPHQVTHMYAQPDQAWANPGWSHQPPWEFTGNSTGVNNEDDWAAKARAWAAGKAAMESQQAQSQFAPINRPVEHQVYQGHYSQPFHTQFAEVQQPSFPALGHQSVQPPAVSTPNITANQVQDSSSHYPNDVSSSYISDVFTSYGSKDDVTIQEQNASGISSQGSIPITTANYSQEMPRSYSSVPGFEEQAKQMPTLNSPLSSSVDLQQDEYMLQAQMHSNSTSQPIEQPHFTYSDQQEAPVPEVSHQQPEFERDAQDYHQHQQSSYLQPVQTVASDGQEYNGPASSVPGWTQLGPFPPVPPAISLNHQFEHPYTPIPHPIHGHPAHLFGRVPGPQPGPGFRPNMPPIGVSFGMGPLSPSLPPGQLGMVGPAFMGDNNGAFGVPERPKKASVPNWLREELKKKAAVVANTSALGHASEDSFRASESEDLNHSFQKSDYTDIKSVDSHRSSDDEDEEDEVEATRTAAINQEIKRVLTEVLKKVTDDLFDEIAQEVLDEDDNIIQVKKQPVNDRGRMKISRASPPPSQVKSTTVSTKVVVSANNATAGSGEEDDNSSSSAPGGNVLGLANYASDDEDDGPDQTQQVSSHVSEQQDANLLGENEHMEDHVGQSRPHESNIIEYSRGEKSKDDQKSDTDDEKDNPRIKEHDEDTAVHKDTGRAGEEHGNLKAMLNQNTQKFLDKGSERNQVNLKHNHNDVEVDKRRSNDFKDKESRSKGIDKTDTRKSVAEVIEEREMKNRKGDGKQHDLVQQRKDGDKGREREREKEKEKRGDRERGKDGQKGREREKEKEREKIKDREKNRAVDKKSDKEKIREREGRKDTERTHDKERKKDHVREKRATDNSKRSDKERGERNGTGKERDVKDTGKRRKRSSSVSSRGRNSKVDSLDSNNSSSEPEGTERTRRRRLQSSRRSSSPSPIRSRKRQVSRSRSRSPHARHSHRRHSPFPSHDARRKQSRSGSRSPARRRR
ncbi:uncharacterized protein LOC131063933 isoform X2 [Cryptomeria japonica]|uniref:uncharacterized protein LOC131063933 isoform X2 n=1 Tax=Cryptomeria japonica TaxID=3369 RepID=UPI0027DA2D9F|nr:uncharacterized protein LOC131063933 isoform X2 [Cryptomeria japonica]